MNASKRTITRLADGARQGVRLSEAAGEGPAYLPGIEFANGTIELDLKGKDVQGASFVGVAFHGVDGTDLRRDLLPSVQLQDGRPGTGPSRRAIHLPSRASLGQAPSRSPGQYEKPVAPVPDPNAWFHARVVVASPRVSVFVGDAKEPCLTVNRLSDRKKGLVGIWVGNGSGGDFANFKIVPA